MTHSPLEVVLLVALIGGTTLLTIGIHRAAPPAPSRDDERRQMRDERRRPAKEVSE